MRRPPERAAFPVSGGIRFEHLATTRAASPHRTSARGSREVRERFARGSREVRERFATIVGGPDRRPERHKGTGASADPFVCEAEPLTTSSSRPSSWSTSSQPSSSWQPWYYLLERRGSSRPIPRWMGGSCGSAKSPASYTASERLVKLKSRTLIAGIATAPPASVPANRSTGPSISRLFNMNSGDSLNRKFEIAREILPCSIR